MRTRGTVAKSMKSPSFSVQNPSFSVQIPSFSVQSPSFSVQSPSFSVQNPPFSVHSLRAVPGNQVVVRIALCTSSYRAVRVVTVQSCAVLGQVCSAAARESWFQPEMM